MRAMGFWSTTPSSVQADSEFDICIDDSSQAGETITVSITKSDGTPGDPPTIDITLDGEGKGCKKYTAPNDTSFLTLSAEGQSDHTVTVTQPTGP